MRADPAEPTNPAKPMSAVSRFFDTLFARVLLVQVLVALAIAALFTVLALRQQALELARANAPLWAAALRHGATPPAEVEVASTVVLRAGPPPPGATPMPANPRFRVLAAELRRLGVPVLAVQVSGRSGESVTWLELGQAEGDTRWVGIEGEFEGLDARERGTLGFVVAFGVILLGAWWLSRRVLRPVADLRQAMRRYTQDGQAPGPASGQAPVELRELAQQFAELARQRQALDEQRRTMLAAISHDLRSPLGRIRLAAELLPAGAAVDARRESIVRNVQVADRLLGSFIDLARAEDEPISGRVDLAALLRQALDGEAGVPADVQRDVLLDVLPEQPVFIEPASALALERALRNLLDNARHHGLPPVQVALRVEAGQARLSVRDHGLGIAPEARAAMLQPFARGQSSRQAPGTGLGLAIVQRTAERHGGCLELSDAAPGLLAELRLPLAARPRATSGSVHPGSPAPVR